MAHHGKKYNEAAKKVDVTKLYAPAEALQLVNDTSYAMAMVAGTARSMGIDIKD